MQYLFKNKKLAFLSLNLFGFGVVGKNILCENEKSTSQLAFDYEAHENQKKPKYEFKNRSQHLKDIDKNNYDLIIIGGGCNGAGVFLDGASRGMKCLLVEANDFSAGASSQSTKLIHGGVRYLQDVFEFSLAGHRREKFNLVKEALVERSYFLENAYYLNNIIPIIIPAENILKTMYYYMGSLVYHFVYQFYSDPKIRSTFPMPRVIGQDEIKQHYPLVNDEIKYGVVYYDGQFNDSRMNLDLLFTGTLDNFTSGMKGGNILNYMEVNKFVQDEFGQIAGIVVYDQVNQKEMEIQGKMVVNCTGAFSDSIRKLDDPKSKNRIIPVAGSHLILPQKFGGQKYGLLIPSTSDGRVIFILPWQRHLLVGTTQKKLQQAILNPFPDMNEMNFMISETSQLLDQVPIKEISQNVQSQWTGIRPLVLEENSAEDVDSNSTQQVSRTHVIQVSQSGLVSLMGGQWTTYRVMADETIDTVLKLMNERNIETSQFKKESVTQLLKLSGEFNQSNTFIYPKRRMYVKFYSNKLQEMYGVDKDIAQYLVKNYGERSLDVLKLVENDQTLLERINPGHPFIRAEILYSVKYEMAQDLTDVFTRRIRLGFLDQKNLYDAVRVGAQIFQKEQNLDKNAVEKLIKDDITNLRQINF